MQKSKNVETRILNLKSEEKKYQKINLSNSVNQKIKKESISSPNRIKNKNKLSFIEEANLYLLRRVNNCTPYYNINKWEKDYEKSQYYKMNHCKVPIIDFKKYKKQDNKYKRAILYRNIFNNNKSKSSFYNDFLNSKSDIDYISLNFFLSNKSFEEHSYIIITSLNEIFSDVIKKLFNTIPFLNKKNIIGYTLNDNDKISLLELNKTVKENGLNDGSKIIVQLK